ncbi:DUF2306 domain-containing protein [Nonomuraea basaltis]|uniref:DUF2306 domain-containing protein n=1 Tax=Nonomuraea basaltis TaxID=2495887 RepID=UPI00110C713D|nr:DUF2306 domain-containing protein [Nonomuraea basaltis]TMR88927.1 DUF2306 domain-containing protein [Nonomuraea basaltis]
MTDKSTTKAARAGWRVPTGLIVLSFIPLLAGALRLTELTSGAEVTPENARFFAAPLPVMVHIVAASLYTFLGAFQFAPRFRRRRPGWHRAAGRVLAACGIAAALSGLWMTLFYALPAVDGALLGAFRLVFGSAMAIFIVLGVAAIRRRDIARHRAWMTRGYAIGLGAGTQAVAFAIWLLIHGPADELARALLMGASWAINVAFAEWIIRRRPARSVRAPADQPLTRLVS